MTGFCDPHISHLEHRVSGLEKSHSTAFENNLGHQGTENNNSGTSQVQKPSGSSMDYTGEGSNMNPKTVLDSARGCHGRNGPYFDLEFLWLRAIEDGIGYAWSVNQTATDRFIKPKDQDFKFKPGFRIGVGYNLGYDDWDLHLSYTWHYTHVKTSVNGQYIDGNGTIIGTLTLLPINDGSLTFVAYERGKSRWQNQFNVWDLDLGRNYFVGKHLAVKPTLGLKGALIRQHLQAFLNNADLEEQGEQDTNVNVEWDNIAGRFKSRFWGIGPKVGMSGEWELGAGFSLFGSFHTAALYGQFKTKSSVVAIATSDRVGQDSDRVGTNDGGHINDDFYRLRMMGYTSIGLEWSRCFWDWLNFRLHLGWECQYWWQQMEFLNFKDLSPDGDLSLTGINAGLRFDF